ncbi:MAG: LysR family transcriptional regulator substrate-binding protein, partial [Lachnospiraceae bacterium]|nr:LysR family transcriptional regulator substrate-binding protein [Lachnospiraceae bacterium]
FLSYAKQAVSQYELIEDRFLEKDKEKKHFSVSMQHYVFAVHAFLNTVRRCEAGKYVYSVKETRTDEVLTNVREIRSEIGVIAYSKHNENVLKKLFREYQLEFYPLMVRETFAYVWKDHPLALEKEISLEDLKEFPCVSFDQSSDSEFYLSEEALENYDYERLIKSNDRATSAEIMAALNGYSIGTGIMTDSIALKDGFITIKLKEEDPLTIGYILRKNHKLSDIGELYIEELEKYKE